MADSLEIRELPRVKAKRPVLIITDLDLLEAESREITETGIFLKCAQKLRRNETYRLAIRLSPKKTVIVKGKLILSNLDGIRYEGAFYPNRDISFIKVLDEDRQLLNDQIVAHLQAQKGRRQSV